MALVLALVARGILPAKTETIDVANGQVLVNNDGQCSLIEAIRNANNTVDGRPHQDCAAGDPDGADTIRLPQNGTFFLTEVHNTSSLGANGLPWIGSEITIEGRDSKIARQTGTPELRLLAVGPDGGLTLKDVNLAGGANSDVGGGGILVNEGKLDFIGGAISYSDALPNAGKTGGGAIMNLDGTVHLTGVRLVNNTTNNLGGAIYSEGGALSIEQSTILDNEARYSGGGVFTDGGQLTISNSEIRGNLAGSTGFGGGVETSDTTVIIENSTFEDNEADGGGGGIHLKTPSATITSSTFTGNSSPLGGAISQAQGPLTLVNSTLSGNEAGESGAGLYKYAGSATIINSTITGNKIVPSGGQGGGIYNRLDGLTLSRTILSGNLAGTGPELYVEGGTVQASNYNIFGHSNNAGLSGFSGGITDIVPAANLTTILAGLTDNGGPTETHALPSGSPAIDAAPSADCLAAPVSGVDQRGEDRNADGNQQASVSECDIGSFEFSAQIPTSTPTVTFTPTATASLTPTPTATATATQTPTSTATATATQTPTSTATPPVGATATNTATPTATGEATLIPTATATVFSTRSVRLPMIVDIPPPTATPTFTPSPTTTSTPTATPTSTATITPSPTSPPPSGIANGNFEKGRNGDWFESSEQGWDLIVNEYPNGLTAHSGQWLTWLGGDNDELAGILQEITISPENPVLSYWLWISSSDICLDDVGGVGIDDGNESEAVDAFYLCYQNNTGGWIRRTIGLNKYAGRTVTLIILAGTDSTLESSLFVDDVSLVASSQLATSQTLAIEEPDQLGARLKAITTEVTRMSSLKRMSIGSSPLHMSQRGRQNVVPFAPGSRLSIVAESSSSAVSPQRGRGR